MAYHLYIRYQTCQTQGKQGLTGLPNNYQDYQTCQTQGKQGLNLKIIVTVDFGRFGTVWQKYPIFKQLCYLCLASLVSLVDIQI